jgi:F-type H+-transporting ATPase subunit b
MEIFPNWTVLPIVLFLIILTYLLNRLFFRPMSATIAERHNRIEGARHQADEIRRQLQARQDDFDRKLRDARRESGRQIAGVKDQALEEKGAIVSAKRSEAEAMLNEAKMEIRNKAEQASRELEKQSQAFAVQIASQILKRPVRV